MRFFASLPVACALWSTSTWAFQAYMTFNDYGSQSSVTCGGDKSDRPDLKLYAAAASDNSPDLFSGSCAYTAKDLAQDMSQCGGGYSGPSCTNSFCGKCFKVTNGGNSIFVKIVDTCPKFHAANYCKVGPQYTLEDKCAASDDHLDVSEAARSAIGLTGNNGFVEVSPAQCPTSPSDAGQTVDQSSNGQGTVQPGTNVNQQGSTQQGAGQQTTGQQTTGQQTSGQQCTPYSSSTDINGQVINCGGNGIYYSTNGQPTPANLLPGGGGTAGNVINQNGAGTRRLRFAKRRVVL